MLFRELGSRGKRFGKEDLLEKVSEKDRSKHVIGGVLYRVTLATVWKIDGRARDGLGKPVRDYFSSPGEKCQ